MKFLKTKGAAFKRQVIIKSDRIIIAAKYDAGDERRFIRRRHTCKRHLHGLTGIAHKDP